MSHDLEELIEQYRKAIDQASPSPSQRQAEIAHALWSAAKLKLKHEGKVSLRAGIWFKENVSEQCGGNVEIQLAILATGDTRLFEEIDQKALTLYQARNLMTEAKELARLRGLVFSVALTESLARHRDPKRHEQPSKPPPPLPEDLGEWSVEVSGSRDLHAKVMKLAKQYVDTELAAVEPADRLAIARDFAHDFRVAYEELLRKVRRYRRDVREASKVSLAEMVAACECLGVKLPTTGMLPDMRVARESHRRLSTQLHPDRRQGNHDSSIVQQYTAVQEAWRVLQDYERQLKQ